MIYRDDHEKDLNLPDDALEEVLDEDEDEEEKEDESVEEQEDTPGKEREWE